MKIGNPCLFLVVILCVHPNTGARERHVRVDTKSGPIRGKRTSTVFGMVSEFLGIPYAQPPVGDLRFQNPQRAEPWRSVLSTTKLPQPCMQVPGTHDWESNNTQVSEDCLYLNVWTSALPTSIKSKSNSGLRPVFVWIHGGGYAVGSSEMAIYNGAILSALGDVVVVNMNYRLGIFGFLNFGTSDVPGNMGLYDQYLAIEWIKNNAKVFGGDPDKITVGGESAGAMSVNFLMISPLSQNLFTQAILHSGAVYQPLADRTIEDYIRQATQFGEAVGCHDKSSSSNDQITSCIRSLDAVFLTNTERAVTRNGSSPFFPSHGNEFMPISPMEAMEKTDYSNKTTLMGAMKDDGSLFLYLHFPERFPNHDNIAALTLSETKVYIAKMFAEFPPAVIHAIVQNYTDAILDPSNSTKLLNALYNSFGDAILLCTTETFAKTVASNNGRSYFFLLAQRPSNSRWAQWIGATHFDDIYYLFGLPFAKPQGYHIEDKLFSMQIMTTWIHFIRTGTPRDQMGTQWPSYSWKQPLYVELSARESFIAEGPHPAACQFWYNIFKQSLYG